jgi:hypothetical protein
VLSLYKHKFNTFIVFSAHGTEKKEALYHEARVIFKPANNVAKREKTTWHVGIRYPAGSYIEMP